MLDLIVQLPVEDETALGELKALGEDVTVLEVRSLDGLQYLQVIIPGLVALTKAIPLVGRLLRQSEKRIVVTKTVEVRGTGVSEEQLQEMLRNIIKAD